jgi:hypothetical protein
VYNILLMSKALQIKDTLMARGLARGSAIACKYPVVSRALGTTHSLTGKPVRWQYVPTAKADPNSRYWFSFAGNEAAGSTPAGYTETAVFSFAKSMIAEQIAEYQGQEAVAYLVGKTAVMCGTLDEGELYGTDPDDISRAMIGMGIGKGVLRAMPGLLLHGNSFVGFPTVAVEVSRRPAHEVVAPIARV